LKKLRAADEAAFRRVEKRDLKEESDCAEVEEETDEDTDAVLVIVEEDREVDSELRLDVVEYERRVGLRVKSSQESVGLA
jgi:hypothetical protein